MTKSQVTYVVNTLLDDATDAITPLRKCAYFVMTKEEVKFNKHIKAHFYFDTANELVRVMPYKIVKEIPSHSNYQQINGTIYEYLTDDKGLVCDIYPFSEIILFKVLQGVE